MEVGRGGVSKWCRYLDVNRRDLLHLVYKGESWEIYNQEVAMISFAQ